MTKRIYLSSRVHNNMIFMDFTQSLAKYAYFKNLIIELTYYPRKVISILLANKCLTFKSIKDIK